METTKHDLRNPALHVTEQHRIVMQAGAARIEELEARIRSALALLTVNMEGEPSEPGHPHNPRSDYGRTRETF